MFLSNINRCFRQIQFHTTGKWGERRRRRRRRGRESEFNAASAAEAGICGDEGAEVEFRVGNKLKTRRRRDRKHRRDSRNETLGMRLAAFREAVIVFGRR